jgi:CubicO group peptidase (beta-lactamase class C family)
MPRHDRQLLPLVAITCATLACAAQVPISRAATQEDVPDPAWLREKLEEVRQAYGLPALVAAVVEEGRIIAASAAGLRKLGDRTPVSRDDRFQLGSVTKPMTATLAAILVEEGILDWETTIEQMFPKLLDTMQPVYRKVTVAQLLSHTSGMPYQPHASEAVTDGRSSTTPGRRYEYVKAAVVDPPECAPGTKVVYSGGAIVVAAYLERKLKVSYETLMKERVFSRLGMKTAGFGSMATPGRVDGPWSHRPDDRHYVPVPPQEAFKDSARAPVGRNVHCSVIDLARFAGLHLDGARGRSRFLSRANFERLHTRMPGGRYAPGWIVDPTGWPGAQVIWHNGDTGVDAAHCTLGVERDFAVCIMVNAGGETAMKAFGPIQRAVDDYLQTVR